MKKVFFVAHFGKCRWSLSHNLVQYNLKSTVIVSTNVFFICCNPSCHVWSHNSLSKSMQWLFAVIPLAHTKTSNFAFWHNIKVKYLNCLLNILIVSHVVSHDQELKLNESESKFLQLLRWNTIKRWYKKLLSAWSSSGRHKSSLSGNLDSEK